MLPRAVTVTLTYLLLLAVVAPTFAQRRRDDVPGYVRLDSGLVLGGICSDTNTIHPRLLPQQLQLRRIDQEFRSYFVHTRHSEAVVEDASVSPDVTFPIVQRRESGRPMNLEIGVHQLSPLDERGRCEMRLNVGGSLKTILLGVKEIDFQQIRMRSLSHTWEVGYGVEQFPDAQLYSGKDQPGLLTLSPRFSEPDEQLNAVQMLIRARRFQAAGALLNDLLNDHPELKDRAERLVTSWHEQVGLLAVSELERFQLTGRNQLARIKAQNWPEEQLPADIRVRLQEVEQSVSEQLKQLTHLQQALGRVLGEIQDPMLQRDAQQLHSVLIRELDLNNLSRLDSFDLLQIDESLSAESKLAIAASSLWLGPDNAIDNFVEAFDLLQLRFLIIDYCRSEDEDEVSRTRCLEEIRKTEGGTPERIRQVLATLPPVAERPFLTDTFETQAFDWIDEADGSGCVGMVPEEYQTSHRYPLLLAFPRAGGTTDEVVSYWAAEAQRAGFILAIPEIRDERKQYTASAAEHEKFRTIFRRLKSELSIDTDRVFIVGHGMGGSAAMDLATAFPDAFAAVASVAGLGRKHLNWTIHNGCQVPWYVVAGTRQPRYYQRFGNILEKLFRPSWKRSVQRYHDVVFARYQDRGFEQYLDSRDHIFQWLNLQKRGKSPATFDSKVIRSSDEAGFWVQLDPKEPLNYSMEQGAGIEEPLEVTLSLSAYRRGNLFRIASLPGPAHVLVYSELDDFEIDEPIRITSVRSRSTTHEFRPNVKDMLDHFRQHLDPSRICLMKIPVDQ